MQCGQHQGLNLDPERAERKLPRARAARARSLRAIPAQAKPMRAR